MTLKNDVLLKMYEEMILIRTLEEKIDELISFGKITGTTHLGIGHEAVMVGLFHAIKKTDYHNITHRMHGLTVLRGDINAFMAELHGRESGLCKGRGGSTHMMDIANRNMGANGIIGSCIPVNAGMALALQMQHKDNIFVCSFGDGTLNEGAAHEGFNLAAVWKLPIVFLCENNQYAMSTPLREAFAIDDLSVRARAYGFPGTRIDGMDIEAVYNAISSATERAREGKGPELIVAETYRYKGHSKSDMQKYRPKDEVREWKEKDPIKRLEEKLVKSKTLDEEKISAIGKTAEKAVDDSIDYAQSCPYPSPDTLMDYVYYEEV